MIWTVSSVATLGFLPEIYALRRAIDSIKQRYFDGQQPLFPAVAEGFDQLLDLVEKTVGIYNDALPKNCWAYWRRGSPSPSS